MVHLPETVVSNVETVVSPPPILGIAVKSKASSMDATMKVTEYLAEHGPSTWEEIQTGTQLSKATTYRVLQNDEAFASTNLPNTLYTIRGGPEGGHRPTCDRIIRNMVRAVGQLYAVYRKDCATVGKRKAEANAEIRINKYISRFSEAIGRMPNNES